MAAAVGSTESWGRWEDGEDEGGAGGVASLSCVPPEGTESDGEELAGDDGDPPAGGACGWREERDPGAGVWWSGRIEFREEVEQKA